MKNNHNGFGRDKNQEGRGFGHRNPGKKRSGLILYGRHAVKAALHNPVRKNEKLLCTEETAAEIRQEFPDLPIVTVDRKDIATLLSSDAVHQGFALYTNPLASTDIEDVCSVANNLDKCCVLILDQVTDPQNIGAIIRSAAAFGAIAVIIQDKNSPMESGAMAKAAAGTLELIPLVRVTNLTRALETLKKCGFWIVGMDGYAQQTIDKVNKNGKTAVVLGSEGTGMRRLVEESCDMTVRLPISDQVESLNVSTAAAIVLYELNK